MIPSVELVIGLVGSTIGVAICIMFPAACFRKIIKKDTNERKLAQFILVSGFCLMILGTYANLSAIDEKSSGSHLELSKIDEDLFKPTEIIKESIDEKIKNIEKALEEKDKEKEKILAESRKLVQNLMEKGQKDNLNETKIIKEKLSPPPLPVDEPHPDVAKHEKAEEKPIKTLEDKAPENLTKDMQDDGDLVKKLSKNLTEIKDGNNNSLQSVKQIPDKKTTASGTLEIQPQTIDNDAIKKDDEVAKEEYKQENEELKKTQKELEITKDLLEKKVEELKEELVKQNQETQNLVVEKLGEVVEKFEAIERKVKNQNEDISPPKSDLKETIDNSIKKENENLDVMVNETNNYKPNKGSLISILTDNRALNSKNLTQEKVYEPLSYKTGELMEQVQKNSTFEKRLPLPLALLINASQAKMNESINAKPLMQLNQSLDVQNKTQPIVELLPNNIQNQNFDKLNVDAIRRDILQLKPNLEETTTTNSNDDISSIHRNKRSYQSLQVNGNCLTEPKVDNLLTSNLNAGLEIKIGRDLKSIKDEE